MKRLKDLQAEAIKQAKEQKKNGKDSKRGDKESGASGNDGDLNIRKQSSTNQADGQSGANLSNSPQICTP